MTRETGIGQPPTERRCAVYTRKSSEDGLELEYNSLDAQYDAAVAYIRSQAGNGWLLLEKRYDDGGFSGGNTNRPALKELLADIEAGKIDIVVVYKIDRLSRSLCDFTDLSRTFERHGVSFVSVTQQIDTSSPAGRMVLNVLMTFAQFEREMTSDRIKDKMLATRRRGMWTGGIAPYGYRIEDKRLVPDPKGAEAVRFVFRRYAETGSPKTVAAEVSRQFGPRGDGSAWNTANVYRMLRNSIYAGMMPHKRTGQTFKGLQEAIVDAGLWEDCQRIMDEASSLKPAERRESTAILKGLLKCGHCGGAMTPAFANKKAGRRYCYYRCVAAAKAADTDCPVRNISGEAVERLVLEHLGAAVRSPEFVRLAAGEGGWTQDEVRAALADFPAFAESLASPERARLVRCLVEEVVVRDDGVDIVFRKGLSGDRGDGGGRARVHVECSLQKGPTRRTFAKADGESRADAARATPVVAALGRAWRLRGLVRDGVYKGPCEIARALGISRAHLSEGLVLTRLSPVILGKLVRGELPEATAERFGSVSTPFWHEQHRMLGIG